jgi:hypothetical protein
VRSFQKCAQDLEVGDHVAPVHDSHGPVERIEANPARGSTGRWWRVYWRDVETGKLRSTSVIPHQCVTVIIDEGE